MTAVRFCVAHSVACQDYAIDEEAAKAQFKDLVPDAVLKQAVPVDVKDPVRLATSGPCAQLGPVIVHQT